MAVKNIYVRKGDESFWAWAEEQADRQKIALSVWLTRMIQRQKYGAGSGEITEPTVAELANEIGAKVDILVEKLGAEP